jgi:hypothetical protein
VRTNASPAGSKRSEARTGIAEIIQATVGASGVETALAQAADQNALRGSPTARRHRASMTAVAGSDHRTASKNAAKVGGPSSGGTGNPRSRWECGS